MQVGTMVRVSIMDGEDFLDDCIEGIVHALNEINNTIEIMDKYGDFCVFSKQFVREAPPESIW